MAGNLNISKSDTNLVKEDLIAQRIGVIMFIISLIALLIFIVSDGPSRNYNFDPIMEEFCSTVKVSSSDPKSLVDVYKCGSYYGMKMALKTMLP